MVDGSPKRRVSLFYRRSHGVFPPLSIFSAGHMGVSYRIVFIFLYKYCWNTPSDISALIGSRSVAPIDY